MNDVLVVLNNWKRITNMPRIIQAWREQSHEPKHLVIVDNTPLMVRGKAAEIGDPHSEWYPKDELQGADDVWRWRVNAGCSAHFAPAWMNADCKYVIFADDDLIPGKRAIEMVLGHAENLGDQFATIGQIGRNFRLEAPTGQRYVYGNAPVGKCNVTNRVHLVLRKRLCVGVLWFREELLAKFGEEAVKLTAIHDDLLMCLGLQWASGMNVPSYVFSSGDPEGNLIADNISHADEHSVYKRPEHLAERCRFVDMAVELGWRSLR